MIKRIYSIRTMLYCIVFIATIPSLAIIAYTGMEHMQQEKERSVNDIRMFVDSIVSSYASTIGAAHAMLSTLATTPEVLNVDREGSTALFQRVVKTHPDIVNIFMADSNADLVSSALPFPPTNVSDRKYYREAVASRTFSCGEYVVSRITSQPVFHYSYPVIDDQQRVIAVIVVATRLDQFDRHFSGQHFPAGAVLGVLDHKGIRLHRQPVGTGDSAAGKTLPAGIWNAIKLKPDGGTISETSSDSIQRTLVYRGVRIQPDAAIALYLIAGFPMDTIEAQSRAATMRSLSLVLVASLCAFGLAWATGTQLVLRRVHQLVQAAQRYSRGDFGTPTGLTPADGELGLVGEALDNMSRARRQAEELRRTSEARFRSLETNGNDLIFSVDRHGNFTYLSPNVSTIIGHDGQSLIGKPFMPLVHPDDIPLCIDSIHQTLETGARMVGINYRVLHKDGNWRWHSANTSPLQDPAGNNVELMGTSRDMTEHLRMQEVIQQSEKMLSVGGLAAGMAHEINNPLGAIMQGIQNFLRRTSTSLPRNREVAEAVGLNLEALQRYMEERKIVRIMQGISDAGARAARIVQGMLDFCRDSTTQRADCSLSHITDGVLELIQNDYDPLMNRDGRKVAITRTYPAEDVAVPCTEAQIAQVLLNICQNALQAMAGNTAQTEAPALDVSIWRDGDFARIDIKDNGPGMDETTRRKVFDPFFTTRAPGVGTGLGLYVSYFIVANNHGGKLLVQSEPGKGTCVSVLLPLQRRRNVTAVPPQDDTDAAHP